MDPDNAETMVERAAQSPLSGPFRALFDAELAYVCRSLRRLGIREAELDDVAQEVFVHVHRRFEEYDASRPVRPWLFSFALRVAANQRRLARHRREVGQDDVDVHASDAASPEQDALRAESRRLVLEALDGVELDRRAVLIMHELDGVAAPGIAEALGIPLNTVYSRLRTAREEFRAAVSRAQARSRS